MYSVWVVQIDHLSLNRPRSQSKRVEKRFIIPLCINNGCHQLGKKKKWWNLLKKKLCIWDTGSIKPRGSGLIRYALLYSWLISSLRMYSTLHKLRGRREGGKKKERWQRSAISWHTQTFKGGRGKRKRDKMAQSQSIYKQVRLRMLIKNEKPSVMVGWCMFFSLFSLCDVQ